MDHEPSAKWWQLGKRPDYRFSLANERTFLAWIRTGLALIAGAIGIDQFAVHLGSHTFRVSLAVVILVAGGVAGGLAYRRWVTSESAMRQDQDIPHTVMFPALTIFVALLATVLTIAVVAL